MGPRDIGDNTAGFWRRAPWAAPGLLSLILAAGLAVAVSAPLAQRGWLLLLDWIPAPHLSVPRSFWGLDGGLLSSLPFGLASLAAGRILGQAVVGWLPVALGVGVAAWSMTRLVGGPLRRRVPAAVLYAVNPLVYERVFAGHVAYLLAYALLPVVVGSILRAARSARLAEQLRPALWVTALVGLGPHYLWIVAVVCIAVVTTNHSTRAVRRLIPMGVGTALTSAYLVLPLVGRPAPITVGIGDLAAFRTSGDPRLGLFANVAGLYGFWRQEPPLPKADVPGWPFFLAAILLLAATGAYRAWRALERRELVAVVCIAGLVGYFLALGDQGPTGPAFRWLFLHLPGFAIMREPQKFVVLVAVAYAVLFGLGAEAFFSGAGQHWRRITAAVAVVALPVCYTPTLFFGLAGRIGVSHYPSSWAAADRLMGNGPGKALFLPWHQYLSFPFTNRTIANPADGAFRREVIVGDNVELRGLPSASRSPRSAYLEFLYRSGPGLCSFGDLVGPLGVEFVILARAVDWQNFTWLDRQVDLVKILDLPELSVYRNLRFSGIGWRSADARQADNWGEVVELSRHGALSTNAVVVRHPDPGQPPASQSHCQPPSEAEPPPVGLTRRSPVTYVVPAGPPGMVVLSEPFDSTWRLDGKRPLELAGGVTGIPAPATRATVEFGHWNRVRLGYAVSGCAVAALLIGSFVARRR